MANMTRTHTDPRPCSDGTPLVWDRAGISHPFGSQEENELNGHEEKRESLCICN